jgi:uncharacterized protein (TIGR02284 family)
MAMEKDDLIDTLNVLIETCKDGEKGFNTCAEDIASPQLKATFAKAAAHCADAARELQAEVQKLGGKPERHGSLVGSAHRRWVDIKSAILGKDDVAVIAECERGEDVAKECYEKALKQDLPPAIKAMVQQQYIGVLAHHDFVRRLELVAKAGS